MKLLPRRGTRSAVGAQKPVVRVLRFQDRLGVWLCDKGKLHSLTGTVNIALAADASRYGQDLVGALIDRTLREADRRLTAS
jgi:hypothetical protein